MATSLAFEDHGEAIGRAATVLRANAGAVSLDTPVPTCPGWTVRDLVVHQGVVHRWATALVEGAHPRDVPEEPFLAEADGTADLLGWFDEGATALLQALASAPSDRRIWFFLPDAPPPREGWARRQAHETTIHAVDAMAARLGRAPTVSEVWFGSDLALDGIDELLQGFVPRDRAGLRYASPVTLRVAPSGTDRSWAVRLSPDAAPVTQELLPGGGPSDDPRAPAAGGAETVLAGSPVEVYLVLWNRGAPRSVTGDAGVLATWRERMTVSW